MTRGHNVIVRDDEANEIRPFLIREQEESHGEV